MKYIVHGQLSKSYMRAIREPGVVRCIQLGPYKRLKFAKKIRASWNKDRAMFWSDDGTRIIDHGPMFARTWIEAVEA